MLEDEGLMGSRDGGFTSVRAQARCALCGEVVACLDEEDRCEQCVLSAERLASEVLPIMEDFVRVALRMGLSEDELREAFELVVGDREGELAELSLSRDPAAADRLAVWHVSPYSAWMDQHPEYEPNRIRRLRRERGLSAEVVSRQLGVPVAELALWEHTLEVPEDIAQQLASMFGVSVPHLMKTDLDWLQG
jgi:DNA-binding transcriptional regulator YiaG